MKTYLCDPFLLVKFSVFAGEYLTILLCPSKLYLFISNIKRQCFAVFHSFGLVIFCLPTVFLVAENHNLYFIAKHN